MISNCLADDIARPVLALGIERPRSIAELKQTFIGEHGQRTERGAGQLQPPRQPNHPPERPGDPFSLHDINRSRRSR